MSLRPDKASGVIIDGVLFSYSQIFFSKNRIFAVILLLVTFFDLVSGISGLISVITANLAATLIGYNKEKISSGLYGFNSLLVGLGLGIFYHPDFAFLFVLLFAALFTLFLTIWMEGYFGKYGLPYLSWPFLFGIWVVTLASKSFSSLEISERGIYIINELYGYGGISMVKFYDLINNLPIHESVIIYFKSLGAIFFQYHLLAGVLIAIGLIVYSRIGFLLSLVGFFTAYFYYLFIGANLNELSYEYIGFNYILTAIAIGGFFVIPSKYSFLWVILLTPIISFIITSTSVFFYSLQLSIYSLAFNIIVVVFIYVLKFRERYFTKPELVSVQQYSPEQNLYAHQNYRTRFDVVAQLPIVLPFIGEWTVTQAHDGKETHLKDWRHAWDFEIFDEDGKKFTREGLMPEDYYCYNKAVVAPADGIVQEIKDGLPDNPIGEMNLEKNWGNTLVIKHHEKLYTKISHLKNNTFKVNKGDFVKRGDVLVYSGSSGRSPLPHIHFQVQETPFIGSKTIDYPLTKYILKTDNGYELKTYSRPLKDQTICNIAKNESLFKAFNFIPGQKISFELTNKEGEKEAIVWEVKPDFYNTTYIECNKSGSKAWFKNDGTLFYFTHFDGDMESLLYYFYLGTYKVVLGFYKNLQIHDTYPLAVFKNRFMLFWQDFMAPFHFFMKASYTMKYVKIEDDLSSSFISLASEADMRMSKRELQKIQFNIEIDGDRISRFEVNEGSSSFFATETKS
jgi:urea transporter